VDFIKRELSLGITFARLAVMETGMGTPEDAHRAKANATRAYGEFTKFLPMVEHHLSAKDRAEIEDMRNQLDQLLSLFSS
jgi:hypothetical protein